MRLWQLLILLWGAMFSRKAKPMRSVRMFNE